MIPYLMPNQSIIDSLDFGFNAVSLVSESEAFRKYLQTQQLNPENVCSVLRTLVSIEDVTTLELYTKFMMPNVLISKLNQKIIKIALDKTDLNPEDVLTPVIDEAVLVPMDTVKRIPRGKEAVLALLHPPHGVSTKVVKVTRSNIELRRVKRKKIRGQHDPTDSRYLVILRSPRIMFRLAYRALKILSYAPSLCRYLFPIKGLGAINHKDVPSHIELINSDIGSNIEQLQAVKQIVHGPSNQAPFIVFGPPGTGKTTVIVEAILQLLLRQPGSRILVTAGSNSACNTIALRLCEYFTANEDLQAQVSMGENKFRDYRLIRLFSSSVTSEYLKGVSPLLLQYSSRREDIQNLTRYNIIVVTLCSAGVLVCRKISEYMSFSHVFIDEAGASTEPESLLGIVGIKGKYCHVILSGDHKQLPPVIKNSCAARLGLQQSLMERILGTEPYAVDADGNYDHTLQARLRRNYRSHPKIVDLFSKLFYNDELIPQASTEKVNIAANWNILPNPGFPIIFQATHGVTERDNKSTSSINKLEARVLCWHVKRLMTNGLGGGVLVKEEDIGIIAPYTAQCKIILRQLNFVGYTNIEVGSVEKFQGREKPIIIATLVRSFTGMGFLRSPRRVNVLISRAKSLMILIGNPVTLRYHHEVNYIINQCKEHGTFLFKDKNKPRQPQLLDFICKAHVAEENYIMPKESPVTLPKETHPSDDSSSGNESLEALNAGKSLQNFESSCLTYTLLSAELEKLSLQSREETHQSAESGGDSSSGNESLETLNESKSLQEKCT